MADKRFLACIAVVCTLFLGLSASGYADQTLFPEYTEVKPNVSFWINIYTRYPTTQVVIHDSVDLDIVYDVIDLVPAKAPGARKANRKRMKAASKKYWQILRDLASDPSPQDPDSQRVAALFGDSADAAVFRQASHQVRCQLGQADRFRDGLVRSGEYIDQIRSILTSYGVPEALAYLPHVESSFDTSAYSKFGAAGMWQFTRSTGKRFLTVNLVVDERRDPIAATHAAAQLLKENYEKLGSWPLAITAYNHGAAGMQRAKAMHGDYPNIFSEYNGRTFKFASRNFYSEFLAARKIASDHQRYFGELDLDDPVSRHSIRLEGFLDYKALCRHLGFDPAIIRAMNPALRPPVFNGQKLIPKDYRLNLPDMAEFDGGVSLATLLPDIYQRAQKPSRFYTVQRGDTAGKIARMHHVRVEDLVLANNLNHRATVYLRQRLRIPRTGVAVAKKTTESTTGNVPVEVSLAVADALPNAEPTLATPSMENRAAGDRHPGSASAVLLAKANVTDVQDQRPLTVEARVGRDAKPAVVDVDFAFTRVEQTQRQPLGVINVDVEETIGHYAEWAGVRTSRIRHLNNIPYGKPLRLHQAIQIPLDNVTATVFEARRLSFHENLQKEFFAAHRVEELQQYRVKPGDSYWTLCRDKFDLPLWLLRHYNKDINLLALRANQPLIIPAIQRIPSESSISFEQTASPDV
ncbi:LysM: peptidoglycan-binding lytic transglycosylase [Desulfosarcina variabilis str. Montpellier]|uniref:transglycosylase SLT domain-containing protein n=1 Tax=Desulfosarcina variabilis TaxID=2300 RepID=UPI003AFB122F